MSGQKKKSQVSGNRWGENFLSLTRRHSRMSIRIYIFNFYKKEEKKKKKTVSVENLTGYDDIVSVYFLTFLIES